jgi:hypothetical protein
MTMPEQPGADKASFALVGRPLTSVKLAALFRRLTGKDPTPEEMADLPAWCERLNAQIAAKQAADEKSGDESEE